MSQKILVLPNSMPQAFAGMDGLFETGVLSARAALLLKALYAHGWDDGVVCLDAKGLMTSTGFCSASLEHAMFELLNNGLVRIREGANTHVVELAVLANLEANVWSKFAWWHYRLLDGHEAA